jgi:hypothetical protein
LKIIRAVNNSGFLQAIGNASEGSAKDEHIPCANGARQYQRKMAVEQPQILDKQEARNEASGKIHGEYDNKGNGLFAPVSGP